MGVAFGLGAALAWGLSDYVAARASRAIGATRVVLGMHLVATALLALIVAASGTLEHLRWSDVPFFALVGVLGWGSYLAFYRALAIGPISIASPIVSGYAAVTVVLAVIVLGESLSGWQTVAVGLSFAGVVGASADIRGMRLEGRMGLLGIALAIAAMLLIGGFVFGVAYHADRLGWLVPILLGRGFATVFLTSQAVATGAWRIPLRRSVLAAVGALALIDTMGYVLFNVGVRHADTAVVGAASAPYAVIPIVAGIVLFHERPTRIQWIGVGLVIVGLVLLGLVS